MSDPIVKENVMGNHTGAPIDTQSKRERYHHGDLRRDLLRVAREEIAANGSQGLSLASLARGAGVAQSAPYRHFADRRALLEAVAAEGFLALAHGMRDAMSQNPTHQSAAMTSAYIDFGEGNIELYRLMFASRLTPEAADGSALDNAAGEAFELLRARIALDAPHSDGAALERDVYVTWATLHGLVMLKADGFITTALHRYLARSV